MKAIEILPRLWIGTNKIIYKDLDFFRINNIRYVINLSPNNTNYFKHVTYFNIKLNPEYLTTEMIVYMNKLFYAVNTFITKGYSHNIGILIIDDTFKLSLMFGCAFIMEKLKVSYYDAIKYIQLHMPHNFNINNTISIIPKKSFTFTIGPLSYRSSNDTDTSIIQTSSQNMDFIINNIFLINFEASLSSYQPYQLYQPYRLIKL